MNRHRGTDNASVVHVARREARTPHLGPGERSVIWVQGCHLRCQGCIAAETHPAVGGTDYTVRELGHWIADHAIDGVTISGGEPTLQARALVATLAVVEDLRPGLSVMLYTGYRIEWLTRQGSASQRALLARADLVVDGPYVQRWHTPLRWRGSSNQRLIDVSGRHAEDIVDDRPAGFDLQLDPDLGLLVTGVPPTPGFREWIRRTGA